MIRIRRSAERGHANRGWLESRHTFSFGDYRDPEHMGFRSLRVINEDWIAGGGGFPTHPHRDMEIVTYVLEGALAHQDSTGNAGVIRPGDVQRMSAGTGIAHSEMNASESEQVHLLQIWLLPERAGLAPGYEQRTFPEAERRGVLHRVADPAGRDGAVTIRQDARLYAALLDPGETVEHALAAGRHAWVQVARGEAALNGETLVAGDGAAISDEAMVRLMAKEPTELLLFDLA